MAEEAEGIRAILEPEPATEERPEEIREQMAETRSALTDKIEALEEKVMGTVETAQATVEQTVETVKETVQDTVAAVKRTFDLKYQVDQRPWTMVGASVLAGYALGNFARDNRHDRASVPVTGNGADMGSRSAVHSERELPPPRLAEQQQPSLRSRLLSQFEEEIGKVQSMAIGATMGMLRDWLKQELPRLAPRLEEVMNSATRKLGGKLLPPATRRAPKNCSEPIHTKRGLAKPE
jgi:ElaB/YqjD/DUF883 family membrane-anchored ribosome-binding protein/molybdopterin converting factor small subunit